MPAFEQFTDPLCMWGVTTREVSCLILALAMSDLYVNDSSLLDRDSWMSVSHLKSNSIQYLALQPQRSFSACFLTISENNPGTQTSMSVSPSQHYHVFSGEDFFPLVLIYFWNLCLLLHLHFYLCRVFIITCLNYFNSFLISLSDSSLVLTPNWSSVVSPRLLS